MDAIKRIRNGVYMKVTEILKQDKPTISFEVFPPKKDTDFADNMVIIIETPGFLSSYSGYKNLEYLASIKNIIGKNTREHGTSWT